MDHLCLCFVIGVIRVPAVVIEPDNEGVTNSSRAPLQRDHVAVGNDEQPILLRPLVHAGAGKAGECRQYADARAKYERSQPSVLPTAAVHRYARMQMSGEHVSIGMFLRFVHADERADGVWCVDAVDT